MTDQLIRPSPAARPGARPEAPVPRPLSVSAAVAGLASAGTTLVVCIAVALTGWFLADAGAHGQTTDAVRVGADAWLLGLGSGITVGGVAIGIVPLGLTALLAWSAYRFGRWAGLTSAETTDDRTVAICAAIQTGLYVVVAVVTAVTAANHAASPGLARAVVGAFLLSGIFGTAGLAVGTGRGRAWLDAIPVTGLPDILLATVRGAAAVALLSVAASCVLVVVALARGFNQASTILAGLHLTGSDATMLTLVSALAAPNAVLLGSAYLLGPGFAVGTGTVVSPSAVALGPLPAFPLLAALPSSSHVPAALVAVTAVPPVLAAVGAALVQRTQPSGAYDVGALRGLCSGVGAAVLLTLGVALAGGRLGDGRMADVGANAGDVLLHAVLGLGVGGLLGGLVATWWQRRRGFGEAEADQ